MTTKPKVKCKLKSCKRNAKWTCRNCGGRICAQHSSGKDNLPGPFWDPKTWEQYSYLATCSKCYVERGRFPTPGDAYTRRES